jgi:hypothetical protein
MHALAGIRYVAGSGKPIHAYRDARGSDGAPLYLRLPNGPDRRGRSNRGRYLLDMGQESFLRPVRGWPLPVVCDDRQWLWLVHGWMERYRSRLEHGNTPIPMRVESGALGDSGLLSEARAVLYLERPEPGADGSALSAFAAEDGVVIAPFEMEDVSVWLADTSRPIWAQIPRAGGRARGTDVVEISSYDDPLQSSQRYAYDVDLLEPMVMVLPTAAVPGWNARLDDEPLPVFAAGPDMVGVLVPAGVHRLRFTWAMPGWQAALLYGSLVALGLALLALVLGLAGRVALRRSLALTLRAGGEDEGGP